jgi:hypothetical protein
MTRVRRVSRARVVVDAVRAVEQAERVLLVQAVAVAAASPAVVSRVEACRVVVSRVVVFRVRVVRVCRVCRGSREAVRVRRLQLVAAEVRRQGVRVCRVCRALGRELPA